MALHESINDNILMDIFGDLRYYYSLTALITSTVASKPGIK